MTSFLAVQFDLLRKQKNNFKFKNHIAGRAFTVQTSVASTE